MSPMVLLLLGGAVLMWPGSPARCRIRSRMGSGPRNVRQWHWGLLVIAVPAAAFAIGPAQALATGLAMGTARELLARGRAERERTERLGAVLAGVDAMVAELSVGAHPAAACATAGRDAEDRDVREVFTQMSGRAELGGDVAAGLRQHVAESAAWGRIAAAWETGTRHGIGMGELLTAVREDLRARERYERRAHSALAGARATAVVLATLPLLGIAMGQLIGANPMGTLLTTTMGGVLLVIGVTLTSAGLLWSRSIADGATGSPVNARQAPPRPVQAKTWSTDARPGKVQPANVPLTNRRPSSACSGRGR